MIVASKPENTSICLVGCKHMKKYVQLLWIYLPRVIYLYSIPLLKEYRFALSRLAGICVGIELEYAWNGNVPGIAIGWDCGFFEVWY